MGKELDQSRLGSTARLRRMRQLVAKTGGGMDIYSPLGHAGRVPFRDRVEAPAPKPELADPVRIDVEGVRWVGARVRAGAVLLVADDLNALGFRAYCPLGRKLVFRARMAFTDKRARKVREFAVFAPYLFVGCPPGMQLGKRHHDHIESIVSDSIGALAIPATAIRVINDLELAGKWDSTRGWREKAAFHEGDQVRLTAGPFAGLEGVVETLPRELRAIVSLSLFGTTTPTEVDAGQLEAV